MSDSSWLTIGDTLAIGVLIANGVLAYLTWRTAQAAEKNAASASKAALAADKQATAAQTQASAASKQVELAAEQIRVAGEQVATADRALAAQIQPLLVDEPHDPSRQTPVKFPEQVVDAQAGVIVIHATRGKVSIPVRNVGQGPAEIIDVRLCVKDRDGRRVDGPPCNEITRWVVPVGESGRLNFWMAPGESSPQWDAWHYALHTYAAFTLRVRDRDLGHRGDFVSEFTVERKEKLGGAWQVRQLRVLVAADEDAEDAT